MDVASKKLSSFRETEKWRRDKKDDGGWFSVVLLLMLLLLETASFVSLTLWQEQTLFAAEQRIQTADRLLSKLEEECVNPEDRDLHEQDVDLKRGRRQTMADLFHELVTVQSQVLSSACDQNPTLCTKGPKGLLGETGDAGITGIVGDKGDQGQPGLAGDKGQTGPTGDAGVPGNPGPQGVTGDTGPQGPQGVQGDAGPKGDTGAQGPTGAAGPSGPPGQKGQTGTQGAKGPAGPAGEAGVKGESGDTGLQGPQGVGGPAGLPGKQMEGDCMCVDVPKVTGNFTDVMNVRLHHPLTLHCDVSDPKATVTWQRIDGQPMNSHVQVSGGNIIFSSMTAADEGVYECVANTLLGKVVQAVHLKLFAASPYDCDFEDDFCSWTNTRDDQFDWTRLKGTTPTAATGPSGDHTLGTPAGQYAFIETSSPRTNNDAARLQSAVLNPQQDYCLNFWYHMYGASLGNINVRLSSNGITSNPVLKLTDPSEDKWKQAFFTVHQQPTPFRIIIEGVSGPGYQGDAGIDDIGVVEGACP